MSLLKRSLSFLACAALLSGTTLAFGAPANQAALASRAASADSDFQKLYDAYEQLQISHLDVKGSDDPAYGRRKELEERMAALEPKMKAAYALMVKAEADLRDAKIAAAREQPGASPPPAPGSQSIR